MDHAQLSLYLQNLRWEILNERIQRNEELVNKCTNFQKQCEVVLEGLHVLPLDLTVNCMVPIGKQALVKGKLKHTNEILVDLGEGYFVNYTATQAIELAKRNIKRTQDILENLRIEKNLLESSQDPHLTSEAFGDAITESSNEQDLENWKVQHRRRVKEYRERKSEEEKANKSNLSTEEELFRRLDELELEEELEDEYYRSLNEDGDEDDDDEDEEEYCDEEEEEYCDESNMRDEDYEEKEKNQLVEIKSETLREIPIKFPEKKDSVGSPEKLKETGNILFVEKENNYSTIDTQRKKQLSKCRKVSFEDTNITGISDIKNVNMKTKAKVNKEFSSIYEEINCDLDTDNIPKINFSHSDVLPQSDISSGINNPGDISNICFQPKSILKRTRDDSYNKESHFSFEEYSSDKYSESDVLEACALRDVIQTRVQEKKEELAQFEVSEPISKKKPTSRFKQERANRNN